MRWVALWASVAAIGAAAPALAQDVAPVAVQHPFAPAAPAPVADSDVGPFYAARPGVVVWLKDEQGRAAATRFLEILKHSDIDGFADGPALAASVETALAGGMPADDQLISKVWVRYVQALKRPVEGISFGDPTLQLKPPAPMKILADALAAPSLATHVDAVASVNPFYAALRSQAIAQSQQDDPHVRATLDRLRLVPAQGRYAPGQAVGVRMDLERASVFDPRTGHRLELHASAFYHRPH